jgi:hypothetical protein
VPIRGGSRTSFVSLILLFMWRLPSVWIGGIGAAIVGLLLRTEVGPRTAAVGALAVLTAAVGVTVSLDRRRLLRRRLLFRGPVVSPRRMAALVIALALIVSVTTAIAATFVSTMRQTVAEEIHRRTTPNLKRGFY